MKHEDEGNAFIFIFYIFLTGDGDGAHRDVKLPLPTGMGSHSHTYYHNTQYPGTVVLSYAYTRSSHIIPGSLIPPAPSFYDSTEDYFV